ncbi:hypothetical protein Bca101_080994 [Brassica carinata]
MDTRQIESQLASPGDREEIRRDLRRRRRQIDEAKLTQSNLPNILAAHRIDASKKNSIIYNPPNELRSSCFNNSHL